MMLVSARSRNLQLLVDTRWCPALALLGLLSAGVGCGSNAKTGNDMSMNMTTDMVMTGNDGPSVLDMAPGDLAPRDAAPADMAPMTAGHLVTSPSIAFGNGDCGGTAPGQQTLTLLNNGGSSLTVFASIDNPQFGFGTLPAGWSLLSGSVTGSIAAGASVLLPVTSAQVPAASAAGQDIAGNLDLIVSTQGTTSVHAPVTLSVTPFGATVVATPPTYPFGVQKENVTATAAAGAIGLTNIGNDTVAVSLGAPSDSQFAASVPGGSMLDTAGDIVAVTASFTPTAAANSTATVQILLPAGTPVCGASQSSLTLTGTGTTAGQINANPTSLAWQIRCGTATTTNKTVTITNSTGAAQMVNISLPGGSQYAVSPSGMQTVPTTGLALTVTAPAIGNTGGITPIADLLTIAPSGGGTFTVPLTITPQGGILSWVPNPSPSAINMVSEVGRDSKVIQLLANSGNQGGTVQIGIVNNAGAVGSFQAPGSINVAPTTLQNGNYGQIGVDYRGGTAAGAATGSLTLTVNGNNNLCAALPPGITLDGQTVTATVEMEPSSGSTLSFTGPSIAGAPQPPTGSTWCGTQAAAQKIDFLNDGAAGSVYHITSAVLAGGVGCQYTVQVGGAAVNNNAVTAGGGQVQMVITSTAVPSAVSFTSANAFADTLTVHTDAAGDVAHTFLINQRAYGAILSSFTPVPVSSVSTVAFGTVKSPFAATSTISISNLGDAPVILQQTSLTPGASTPAGTFKLGLPSTLNAAGIVNTTVTPAVDSITATFQPPAAASYTATAILQTNGAGFCQPFTLPSLAFTGTGN